MALRHKGQHIFSLFCFSIDSLSVNVMSDSLDQTFWVSSSAEMSLFKSCSRIVTVTDDTS